MLSQPTLRYDRDINTDVKDILLPCFDPRVLLPDSTDTGMFVLCRLQGKRTVCSSS